MTRRTDIAFWLHLLAAPLIVHPLIAAIADTTAAQLDTNAAVAILAIFLGLGLVSLIIDRRALLVSGLTYAGHRLRHIAAEERFHRQDAGGDFAGARALHPLAQRAVASAAPGGSQALAERPWSFAFPMPIFGIMTDFSPREIVSELDRFIVGQKQAKRAVAIALRNRWRRLRLEGAMRDEVMPKNILMIGPTGCGKTEISRRLAKLANAPFLKVEATKFTEVGYVGRDVEQIVRDLVEIAISMVKQDKRKALQRAGAAGGGRAAARCARRRQCLARDARLLPQETARRRTSPRRRSRSNSRSPRVRMPMFELPNLPGASIGAISIGDIFGKSMGKTTKLRRTLVKDAYEPLIAEESDKLIDQDQIIQQALHEVENNGIVFLDEIDKICGREGRGWRRCLARGRAARSSALDRRHDGFDEAWRGEDGSYSLHRVGRLPCRQTLRSFARAAGPAADPRRARLPQRGRFPPHSRRDGSKPHQAI